MALKKLKKDGISLKEKVDSFDTPKFKPEAITTAVSKDAKASPKGKTIKKFESASEHYIVVDHPINGEIISGLHYAIRIGASNTGAVELNINNGKWQPCRYAAGYWWFDWGYFTKGQHKITARIYDSKGKTLKKSAVVTCKIV